MRGPKLNEGATVAQRASGERHGTKATARYVRFSASKARIVLDLIRGLDVKRADEVLQFTERGAAEVIRKVLASAVANATNPDNTGCYIGDADELFVLACFADEGPTLKRFGARARGRGTRIRKRTCHITVVVARMSPDRLAVVQARAEGTGAGAAAKRRARVERSRGRAQAARAAVEKPAAFADVSDADTTAEGSASDEAERREEQAPAGDEGATEQGSASDEGATQQGSASDEAEQREDEGSDDEGAFEQGQWSGSVLADADGNGPETHMIKGNADSMLYHTPDSRYYKVTKAEVWFDTEENAQAAGFSKPGSGSAADASAGDESADDEGAN
jgi:large subunit ribosomal protein L22